MKENPLSGPAAVLPLFEVLLLRQRLSASKGEPRTLRPRIVREGFDRAVMLIATPSPFQPFSEPQPKLDRETDTESTPPLASMRGRLASLAKDEERAACALGPLSLSFMLSFLC